MAFIGFHIVSWDINFNINERRKAIIALEDDGRVWHIPLIGPEGRGGDPKLGAQELLGIIESTGLTVSTGV